MLSLEKELNLAKKINQLTEPMEQHSDYRLQMNKALNAGVCPCY